MCIILEFIDFDCVFLGILVFFVVAMVVALAGAVAVFGLHLVFVLVPGFVSVLVNNLCIHGHWTRADESNGHAPPHGLPVAMHDIFCVMRRA